LVGNICFGVSVTFVLAQGGLQVLDAAQKKGMDGFCICVQPTADAVCVVAHDRDFGGMAALRKTRFNDLPKQKDGKPFPRLSDALDVGAAIVNIELVGEPGWKNALAAVEGHDSIPRVIFSSLEHSEILQLWAACPKAKCGFIWEQHEADAIEEGELSDLPDTLLLFVPAVSISARPGFWTKYAKRLVVWGLARREDTSPLGLGPAGCIVTDRC